MKKLLVIITISISNFANTQCYTLLNQTENKILDTYGIKYTGLHTRYIMSTNQIDKITDIESKKGMIKSYSEFTKWNNGRLQIIPDTTDIIETCMDYIQSKNVTEDQEDLKWLMNETQNILQKIHFDINDSKIKSIEILEIHMTKNIDCINNIHHMIFIEDIYGYWSCVLPNYDDITLECPFCPVP